MLSLIDINAVKSTTDNISHQLRQSFDQVYSDTTWNTIFFGNDQKKEDFFKRIRPLCETMIGTHLVENAEQHQNRLQDIQKASRSLDQLWHRFYNHPDFEQSKQFAKFDRQRNLQERPTIDHGLAGKILNKRNNEDRIILERGGDINMDVPSMVRVMEQLLRQQFLNEPVLIKTSTFKI